MSDRTGCRWALMLAVVIVSLGVFTPSAAIAQDGSARDEPLAFGDSAGVGPYVLTVLDVESDATSIILEENSFNEAPADGMVFVMVRLGIVYSGDESGSPNFDLGFQAVGARNIGYSTFANSCGVIPEDIYSLSEMFEGGEAEFNICWHVPEADASTLVMYVDEYVEFDDDPVWFSLGLENEANGAGSGKIPATGSGAVNSSTRQEPVPMGTTAQVGDYTVTVLDLVRDAHEEVMAENSFNEEPAEGNQFFLVTVEVTYTGSEVGAPWIDLNFQAVGDESVSYTEFDDSCGVVPDSGLAIGDVFPTGTVSFNVCWQIASDDADSLVMFVDPFLSFDSDDRMWFSLDD